MLSRQHKAKGVHHHQALIMWNVKGTYLRKRRRSKLWTVKWQQTQLSTTEAKKTQKLKLSKQLEQEQNHRNGDHMESYQLGGGRGKRYRE